jgi:hypothetical protein
VPSFATQVKFAATPRVIVAIGHVHAFDDSFDVTVDYLTASEVNDVGCLDEGPTGLRHVVTTAVRVHHGDEVFAHLGGGAGGLTVFDLGSRIDINLAPSATADLLAVLSPGDTAGVPLTILRHDVPAGLDTLPRLDFTSAEAHPFQTATLTVSGAPPDYPAGSMQFVSRNGTIDSHYLFSDTTDIVTLSGIDSATLADGDYHRIDVQASARRAIVFMHALHDTTVTFGPPLAAVTVDTIATSPWLRLRASVPSQLEYPSFVTAVFGSTYSAMTVNVTAAYMGGTPATWEIEMPELPAAAFNMPAGTELASFVEAWDGRWALAAGPARPNPGDWLRAANTGY